MFKRVSQISPFSTSRNSSRGQQRCNQKSTKAVCHCAKKFTQRGSFWEITRAFMPYGIWTNLGIVSGSDLISGSVLPRPPPRPRSNLSWVWRGLLDQVETTCANSALSSHLLWLRFFRRGGPARQQPANVEQRQRAKKKDNRLIFIPFMVELSRVITERLELTVYSRLPTTGWLRRQPASNSRPDLKQGT